MINRQELSNRIQYTNVLADSTRIDIENHCLKATEFDFHAVMIQPCWVKLAKDILSGTTIRIATSICYPMGGETLEMKVEMAKQVIQLDADEFDFEPNIKYLKSGMLDEFNREISEIVREAGDRPVKLVSEFGFLNEKEKNYVLLWANKLVLLT